MKRIIICISIFLLLTSCNRRKPNQLDEKIIESLRKANNDRNYNEIKPFLSSDFHFKGSDINTSFTSLYSYLNFNLSEKISKIEIDYVKEINDSLTLIKGIKYYEKYKSDKLEVVYKLTDKGAKITTINRLRPHKFSVTTRASYIKDEIFGNDPVNNITNLIILDKSSSDSISKYGYTIYFDKKLTLESNKSLILFRKLDSLLINQFEIREIERENLFLTNIISNNTITIGKNLDIPWTMALYNSDSINIINLTNKIGNTFSHEIIEGTLVQKYNLKGYKFRWFRDGLSEYIAYQYCKIVAPKEAESYFIENRLSSASEFIKNGNLLDWRANGPIKNVDKGKLYGSKFIYLNEVGQYGRAFKFFKELFENDTESLIKILKTIKEHKDINIEKLLSIMSEETNKDIIKLISKY
jgi:hypothetical protein